MTDCPDDRPPAVLLDLDGTLVDSVYLHVVAWDAALASAGFEVAQWKIHRAIGMGSDRLLPRLLGRDVDGADEMVDDHDRRFLEYADRLRPTNGAVALVEDLERRGVPFLVATSAGADEREALLAALGRSDLETTDAEDVASSKPSPEPLRSAAGQLGVDPREATMVGDAPWDAEAASRAGMRAIAVRTGGFGADELTRAGAFTVVDDPRALIGRL